MAGENVDWSIASIKTRWYQLQVDLKSARSLLEETAEHWQQYTAFSSALCSWLPEAERALYYQADGWQVGCSFSYLLSLTAAECRWFMKKLCTM